MSADRVALVLLYDGCTIVEVAEVATRLADNGIPVRFVSHDGHAVVDRSGLRMQPDYAVGEAHAELVSAVIVPGGDPASVMGNDRVELFLTQAVMNDVIVAGICAGVLLLAAAGVTEHRHITHNYRSPWCPASREAAVAHHWLETNVEEDRAVGVVRDGNLITALPNASIDFAMTVCVATGVYSQERAAQMARHLRGEHVTGLFRD